MGEPTIVRLERESTIDGMTVRYIVEVQWSATASTAKEQAVDAMKALLSIDAPDLHAEYRRRQS